jgi:hypothetical protein
VSGDLIKNGLRQGLTWLSASQHRHFYCTVPTRFVAIRRSDTNHRNAAQGSELGMTRIGEDLIRANLIANGALRR